MKDVQYKVKWKDYISDSYLGKFQTKHNLLRYTNQGKILSFKLEESVWQKEVVINLLGKELSSNKNLLELAMNMINGQFNNVAAYKGATKYKALEKDFPKNTEGKPEIALLGSKKHVSVLYFDGKNKYLIDTGGIKFEREVFRRLTNDGFTHVRVMKIESMNGGKL